MLTFFGKSARSSFRIKTLTDALRNLDSRVQALRARYVYFVDCAIPPDGSQRSVLLSLLDASAEPDSADPASSIWVIPRLGTISPWASKATDIAHACGLTGVRRIERGVLYMLSGIAGLEVAADSQLRACLHDRMTESLLVGAPGTTELFAVHTPAPLGVVELGNNPAAALAHANQTLGLAMSADEIAYLAEKYAELNRNPSDAELMMFAQANSEHCRHKVFNADWVVDGEPQDETLFGMIRHTTACNGDGVLSAYSDNAAVIAGNPAPRLMLDPESRRYGYVDEPVHILMKVETHNHPTAISPFAGAATGSGGEIRDEGATGLGAVPKAGLTGFSVSHLRIPGFEQGWELATGKPGRIASALDIMLEGPIGGAAFNNEFGRPNLCGYFRSFEKPGVSDESSYGYHKPIMIAGGLGNVRPEHATKIDVHKDLALIVLGGPAMLIGLGGGAASSLASGDSDEDLDFASVQRGNPEMQRRAQEVINRCWEQGSANPIELIHDVGAGGLSNAVPEAVDHSGLGGEFELRSIPNDEPGMSPMAVWCNESQERYVLLVSKERLDEFAAIAERERCPYAVLGSLTDEPVLRVTDSLNGNAPVDLPMDVLLGKTPKMTRTITREQTTIIREEPDEPDFAATCFAILRHPTVADKSFLIHIGDRTVGGLTARDQMAGPWQVPVSDVAVTTSTHESFTGEAMAMGERTPIATIDAPASGRMAIAEALTNIAAADFGVCENIRLSANWMAAAGAPGQDQALFDTVKAVGKDFCPALGIAIPVGKDSLSMRSSWNEDGRQRTVTAPLSLIISAFSPVSDVRRTLTPELVNNAGVDTRLLLLDLGAGKNRLGGSVLEEILSMPLGAPADIDNPELLRNFMAFVQAARDQGLIKAYHDRSDGGLLACAAEMMFTSRLGISLELAANNESGAFAELFSEEAGALLQFSSSDEAAVDALAESHNLREIARWAGTVNDTDALTFVAGNTRFSLDRTDMQREWSAVSFRIQTLRDNPATARLEYDSILDKNNPGLKGVLWDTHLRRPPAPTGRLPRVAILREQGVNSQNEMAAAFLRAGFEATDVHMSDLVSGRDDLSNYQAMVACGGFSFGDVLGAGGGWAKSILYNTALRDQFQQYFSRSDSLSLGVCNGCQMLSGLAELVPGAECWPSFETNLSEQFEARLSLVEIAPSASLFLIEMNGQRLPIATSHGEGRARFASDEHASAGRERNLIAARYVDGYGNVAVEYPANPNGSVDGVCALTTDDGRATIIMPHPERVARTLNNSWSPANWPDDGPWMQMFYNAARALR